MKAIVQILVLIAGSLLTPQGNVVRIGGASVGPPAGTAPTHIGGSSCTGFPSLTSNCGGNYASGTVGNTLVVIRMDSPLNGTFTYSDGGGNSVTCGATHTNGNNRTRVCTGVLIAAVGLFNCTSSMYDYLDDCLVEEIHCAATCVVEQSASYADTAGTNVSGNATSGSVTTAYQQNEILLGGFTSQWNMNSLTSWTAVGSFSILTSAVHSSTYSWGIALEKQTVTSVGTYSALIAEGNLQDSVGFTMAIR